jgi:hypothetical protein
MTKPTGKPRGRPPSTDARTAQTGSVRLTPEVLAWVDTVAQREGTSRATWIARLVERFHEFQTRKGK